MIEQRLPVVSRWVLYALGAVEGRRMRQPTDPVAAWLLKHQPGLLPTIPQHAMLSTIRARTDLVDRMIGEEVHRGRLRGERMAFWSLGSGFDARWFRLTRAVSDVIVEHREVECTELLELKSSLLSESPYAPNWIQVRTSAVPEHQWTVTRARSAPTALIVLELGSGRLDDDALRATLHRLRMDAGRGARLIVGLPAVTGPTDGRWKRAAFARLGWHVEEDVHIATRGRLMAPTGAEVCPGMYAFRVARLSQREPAQV